VTRHQDRHGTGDNGLNLARGQSNGRDAAAAVVTMSFFAIGRVGVLVEVQALGAVLAGKPDDAVAGRGIDPFGGQFAADTTGAGSKKGSILRCYHVGSSFARLRLSDLDPEDVRKAEHVRTKDAPFHVGGKRDIGSRR